ncbi:hypothetical protein [Lysobacter sp. CA199]|uniref:hypothetical protein n=1 Tax=Lysobacter sp. CA199 TaxID=3455608 RepID=UPI003F8D7420
MIGGRRDPGLAADGANDAPAATAQADHRGSSAHLIESQVSQGGRVHRDRNGFVTALAVRTLRQRGLAVPGAMLDGLQSCRSSQGGFRFWPEGAQPDWAPALPDDVDDTAIMALELLRAGRIDLADARRTACLTIARRRIARLPMLHPPWLRLGTFATWSREGAVFDLVDCTATANVLGFLTAIDLSHLPGVGEATAVLEAALRWAGDDELRATSLSPFYPDPAEFVLALEHAAQCGARGLSELHALAAATSWGTHAALRSTHPEYRLCSSPYGVAVWHSPELARLRAWAYEAGRSMQGDFDEHIVAIV